MSKPDNGMHNTVSILREPSAPLGIAALTTAQLAAQLVAIAAELGQRGAEDSLAAAQAIDDGLAVEAARGGSGLPLELFVTTLMNFGDERW